MAETIPLFDPPAGDDSYRKPKRPAKPGRAVWSRYRPKKPVRCDDCMTQLHETGGKEPTMAASARWQRKAGGERRLLCYRHAEIWREVDALPKLKKGG